MAHEDTSRRHTVAASSDRVFGLVIGAALAVITVWPLLGAASPRWWALGLAAAQDPSLKRDYRDAFEPD